MHGGLKICETTPVVQSKDNQHVREYDEVRAKEKDTYLLTSLLSPELRRSVEIV